MKSRYRARHEQRKYDNLNAQDWWERRRQGFGMNLYRNMQDKKVAGVCAGLADHLNVDHWVIRLAAVGGFIFFNVLMFWAYIAAWVCMAPRPKDGGRGQQRYRYDETVQEDRPVNMFRYQSSPSDRLRTAKHRLDDVNARIGRMERYVTSRRFELDKEFSKM